MKQLRPPSYNTGHHKVCDNCGRDIMPLPERGGLLYVHREGGYFFCTNNASTQRAMYQGDVWYEHPTFLITARPST